MAEPPAVAESAIIVPVELPVAIRRLRDRLDYAAGVGVLPHVTLLYPFMPPETLDDGVREDLRRLLAGHAPFPFTLASVGRWPGLVYLPAEPATPFSRLIGTLAAAYPDYPPYGGLHALEDIVPHVTIAENPQSSHLEAAERALPALLPVRGVAREVWLVAQPAAGQRWQTLWQLPLGGG